MNWLVHDAQPGDSLFFMCAFPYFIFCLNMSLSRTNSLRTWDSSSRWGRRRVGWIWRGSRSNWFSRVWLYTGWCTYLPSIGLEPTLHTWLIGFLNRHFMTLCWNRCPLAVVSGWVMIYCDPIWMVNLENVFLLSGCHGRELSIVPFSWVSLLT
jgi:hypothetical protein